MATKIVTKNSSTASAVPTASDLVQGELAVNVADKRLFTENNAGAIVELGTNPSALTVTGNVGIGTSSPSANLEITQSGNNVGLLVAGGSYNYTAKFESSDAEANIIIEDSNSTNDGNMIGVATNDMYFITAAAERMRISSAGNVGIGCVPQGNLDIDVAVDTSLGLRSQTGVIVAQYTGAPAVGNRAQIGLGYGNTYTNVSIGAVRTSATAYGTDDFIIATKSGTADTAPTERMRIDSSGNLLVGKTSFGSITGTGGQIGQGGVAIFTSSGDSPLYLNRITNDGRIIDIYKDGSSVGSIGTNGGRLSIGSGDVNLNFNASANSIYPISDTAGTLSDAIVDVGASTARFKDLYLSGKVQASYIYRADASGAGLHFTTNAIYPTNETAALSDGTESLGAAAYRFKDLYLSGATKLFSGTNSPAANSTLGDVDFGARTDGTVTARVRGIAGSNGNGTDGQLTFYTASNTASQAAQERMRIDSAGNLLVGTTSFANPASGFTVAAGGETKIQINHVNGTGSGVAYATFRYNQSIVGSITQHGTSATLYNTTSDERVKENIADADDAGSKIDAIQVRQYDWKADGSHQDYGMIAQELQAVAPEAVSVPEDSEDMMGVDYSKLVPMLVKEIQSLRNRVAQLEE